MASVNKNVKKHTTVMVNGILHQVVDGIKIPIACHYGMSKHGCKFEKECSYLHVKVCAWCLGEKCVHSWSCIANKVTWYNTETYGVYDYDNGNKNKYAQFYFDPLRYEYNNTVESATKSKQNTPSKVESISTALNVYPDETLVPDGPMQVKAPAEAKAAVPAPVPKPVEAAVPAPAPKPVEVKTAVPAPAPKTAKAKAPTKVPTQANAPAPMQSVAYQNPSQTDEQVQAMIDSIKTAIETCQYQVNQKQFLEARRILIDLKEYIEQINRYAINIGNVCSLANLLVTNILNGNGNIKNLKSIIDSIDTIQFF